MQEVVIDGRTFLFYSTPKRNHPKEQVFFGNTLVWINNLPADDIVPNQVVIGFCNNLDQAKEMIERFFRFSFCLAFDNHEKYPWCIRELINGRRQREIDTHSLCGQTERGSDLIAPVNLKHTHVCETCAAIFVCSNF